jgi:formiminotetrahydrofolate cyclodeaminase
MPLADLRLRDLVAQLGSSAPVPSGGAAAVTASLGATLVSMVAELSDGNLARAAHRETQVRVGAAAPTLADRFLDLADADAMAFAGFGEARRRPRMTDDQRAARSATTRRAARQAAEVPLGGMGACLDLARGAETLAGRTNPNVARDLVVAPLVAEAAARAAAANVNVNLPLVEDPVCGAATSERVATLQAAIDRLGDVTRAVVANGVARGAEGLDDLSTAIDAGQEVTA